MRVAIILYKYMNIERDSFQPSPEEEAGLLKYYSLEEIESMVKQGLEDIKQREEAIYNQIKKIILRGSGALLDERARNMFLENLKEEDFEVAQKLKEST